MNGNDHIKSTLRHLKHQVTSDTVVEATLAFHCRIYWKQLFPFSIDCKCFHQHFPYWLIDNNFEKNESFVSTKTLSLQYARFCLLFKTTSFFHKNTAKNGHKDTQSSNSHHLSSIRQQLSLVLNMPRQPCALQSVNMLPEQSIWSHLFLDLYFWPFSIK